MSSTRPYFEAVARQAGAMPQARYVLPQFEERTAYGFKRQDRVHGRDGRDPPRPSVTMPR